MGSSRFDIWSSPAPKSTYMGYGQHLGCGGGFTCNLRVDIVKQYCKFFLLLLYKYVTKTGKFFCGAGLSVCKGSLKLSRKYVRIRIFVCPSRTEASSRADWATVGRLGPVYTVDHEVGLWNMAFFHGLTSWFNFHGPIF